MENCIFCKIANGEIPAAKLYEDEEMVVFRDLHPQAKVHVLAVPRQHFKLFADMNAEQAEIVKNMLVKIPQIAPSLGLADGYRLIVNQGENAGQTVFHLHMHLLGGEKLPE